VRKSAGLIRKEIVMKRLIAALLLAVLAGSAFAQVSGPIVRPFERVLPGPSDTRDVRDPLMAPPTSGAPLLPPPSSPDTSPMFRNMQPLPLPGQPEPRFIAPPRR